MRVEFAVREPKAMIWTRRHLLDLEDLSGAEIETILDAAEDLVEVSQRRRKRSMASGVRRDHPPALGRQHGPGQ